MIVVDSSVWIDYFNGRATPAVQALARLSEALLLIGDVIMIEVLQGFRTESQFRRAEEFFTRFEFDSMVGREIAIAAGRNYRALRERGVTPRKTIDTIIATFCVTNGHYLLHSDRDFELFEKHLGLQVVAI
jgi:predicted nucleic acid-binding protein